MWLCSTDCAVCYGISVTDVPYVEIKMAMVDVGPKSAVQGRADPELGAVQASRLRPSSTVVRHAAVQTDCCLVNACTQSCQLPWDNQLGSGCVSAGVGTVATFLVQHSSLFSASQVQHSGADDDSAQVGALCLGRAGLPPG